MRNPSSGVTDAAVIAATPRVLFVPWAIGSVVISIVNNMFRHTVHSAMLAINTCVISIARASFYMVVPSLDDTL